MASTNDNRRRPNNRSALSQQLSKLQRTFPNEERLKGGKASILHTARDAADVRLEDIQERAQRRSRTCGEKTVGSTRSGVNCFTPPKEEC